MEYEEFKDKIGKHVRITLNDGKSFSGLLTNTESEFDTSSGKQEVELLTKTKSGKEQHYVGLVIDEIVSVEAE